MKLSNIIQLAIFIPAFLLADQGFAGNLSPPVTLCTSQEQIIFSCISERHKIISICASSDLTGDKGYLQYRFGLAGQKPELTYPAIRSHPIKHFQYGTVTYSGGGGAYIMFDIGKYTYSVFTGIGKGWEKSGVNIAKYKKHIGHQFCETAVISEIGPELFDKLKLKKHPDADNFEMPDR